MRFLFFLSLSFCLFYYSCSNKKETSQNEKYIETSVISDNISNQTVLCFAEDKKGFIWIGTDRGLNRFNGYEYTQYFNNPSDTLSIPNNVIQTLYKDSKNNLWVGTANGIARYDEVNDVFHTIEIDAVNTKRLRFIEDKLGNMYMYLPSSFYKFNEKKDSFEKLIDFDVQSFSSFCEFDNNNRLWIITKSSVTCYDLNQNLPVKTFILKQERPANIITGCYLTDNGNLWIAYGNNIYCMNTEKMEYTHFEELSQALSSVVISMCRYDKDNILINTHLYGLFLYNIKTKRLIPQRDSNFPFAVPFVDASSILLDSRQNLWIGSFSKGFSTSYTHRQQFNTNRTLWSLTKDKPIKSLDIDKNNNLWISTAIDEIIIYNFDSRKHEVIDLKKFYKESPHFRENVNKIYIDRKGYIWLMSAARLVKCKYEKGKLEREATFSLPYLVYNLAEDKIGNIWVSTSSEVVCKISQDNNTLEEIKVFPVNKTYKSNLVYLASDLLLVIYSNQNPVLIDPQTNIIHPIDISAKIDLNNFTPGAVIQDKSGKVWLGSSGLGLYNLNLDSKNIDLVEGLQGSDINSIIEDTQGNLWIGTLYGLYKYNKVGKQITPYFSYDGIGGNQFDFNSVCLLPDSLIAFGGTHGLTIFNPANIGIRTTTPLYFENLRVNNKIVKPGENSNIEMSLFNRPEVRLKNDENSISISYVGLDYSESPRIHYQYKMEGYDKEWVDARNNRQAYYTNLPAGKYTFKVRIVNNENQGKTIENSISIYKKQVLWLTYPAIFLYIILFILLLSYINFLYIRIRENRSRVNLAIQEREHEAQLNRMNISYFTNISHEFRTPLTMIYGPVKTLLKKTETDDESKRLLNIVSRNIERMLRLVNQMLDFNKLENDALKLNVRRIDIVHEIQLMINLFQPNIHEKEISLRWTGFDEAVFAYTDRDKIEKIITNLMSNALKFTPTNGRINVRFEVTGKEDVISRYKLERTSLDSEYAEIFIENSGSTIPSDKMDKIFERYYQIEKGDQGVYNWGTGIGLYFVKRLVELHHGAIKVENSDTDSCIFSFIIPINKTSYKSNELQLTEHEDIKTNAEKGIEYNENDMASTTLNKKEVILVVDDDTEISYYLKVVLSPYYQVINRYDVDSAYKALDDYSPDIIISDIIMPGKDGYQFCNMIKSNISYSHIPVILLTAKSLMEEQIRGLEEGANAYITKPFEPSYLLAVVKSQLKNRDHMRNILNRLTDVTEIEENILSHQDRVFLESLYEYIEKELSNSELNITNIASYFNISRSKLYYKIKGLTGENPNNFFKKYRLNRATELIKQGDYTISEIAIMTGFSTPSHFSSSFKKEFGVTPSEYK